MIGLFVQENEDTVGLGFSQTLDSLMEFLGTEKGGEIAHILRAVPHISRGAERSSLSSQGIAAGTH